MAISIHGISAKYGAEHLIALVFYKDMAGSAVVFHIFKTLSILANSALY